MLKKLFSKSRKRTLAQAMVEFALALPILLMVVYGMLEAGRLLFIYSSVISAARNAVRYASADGTSPNGMPYYQDCAGITAAANTLAFISPLSNIYITYDAGLSYNYGAPQPIMGPPAIPLGPDDPYAQCNSVGSWPTFQSGYRVNVEVQAQYSPIIAIGNLIPSFKPLTITSQSSRTLLLTIPINATANATDIAALTSIAQTVTSAAKTAVAANSATATQTPTKTLTPTNSPVPSNTPTASNTPVPSNTPTPTKTVTGTPPTSTPTLTPTPTTAGTPVYTLTPGIVNCSSKIISGTLTISGTTMSLPITNNTGQALAIQQIILYWNNSTGNSGGPLNLLSVSVAGTTIWTSPGVYASFYVVPFTSASLPTGTNNVTATFNQTYNTSLSGSEIYVQFWTNGCQYYPAYGIQP
jgi:Flp pilus assembly protein TadG